MEKEILAPVKLLKRPMPGVSSFKEKEESIPLIRNNTSAAAAPTQIAPVAEPEREIKTVDTAEASKVKNFKSSTEIDSSTAPKAAPQKVQLNLMNEDHLKSFVKAPSQEPKSGMLNADGSQKTTQQIEQDIKKIEEQSKPWETKDYQVMATFIIEAFDTGITLGLRWFAKDTSDREYQIPKEKKTLLIEQLTYLLIKYQKKSSIEFMFIATIIFTYGAAGKKAWDRRKDVLALEKINAQLEETKKAEKIRDKMKVATEAKDTTLMQFTMPTDSPEELKERVENKLKKKRGKPGM